MTPEESKTKVQQGIILSDVGKSFTTFRNVRFQLELTD